MFYRRNWIAVTVVILGLIMFMPVAQAQRQDFENINCSVTTINSVHISPALAITSWDMHGITQSPQGSKLFDNWSRHSVMVYKRIDKKISWNGFTKALAPDGELIIWEFSGDSISGTTTANPIYGTGKWKGVKGESKSKRLTSGKRIIANIEPYCDKAVGWIEVPK